MSDAYARVGRPVHLAVIELVSGPMRGNVPALLALELRPFEEPAVLHAFWRDVAAQLMLGRLVAQGFKAGADQPSTIRPEFFGEAVPDYKANSVTSHGLTYYSVRIFTADPAGEIPVSSASAEPSTGDVDERSGDMLSDEEVRVLAGSGRDAPPPAAIRWFWNQNRKKGKVKIEELVPHCARETGCNQRQARRAGRTLPPTRRYRSRTTAVTID